MNHLTFQYPAWYLVLCVLLGAGYAAALYYRDTTYKEQRPAVTRLLAALRFLGVTLLSMLLLSPMLKSLISETKKPVVVLAQDQSESIRSAMNDEQLSQYKSRYEALKSALGGEYEIREYAFGETPREGVDFAFKDKVTDLAGMMKAAFDNYSTQNLGAIILATDGIYNEGSNPLYAAEKLASPVYCVALGDTVPKKDVVLKKVFHNNIAYLGDKFSLQIDIAARNCNGASTTLTVAKVEGNGRRTLQTQPIAIDRADFFSTREVVLDADQPGVQRYVISLSQVSGEATAANNGKDIFIDVLDARQKVLVIANAPHPDLSAINQAVSGNKNYQVTTVMANELKVKVTDYDLVILHQLPSRTNDAGAILRQLAERKIPQLFIVGTQSDLSRVNAVQNLAAITGNGQATNDVQARVAGEFNLFTVDEKISKELPNFAPLMAPFGDFRTGGTGQVLLYQRIGKVDTRYPLWMLGENAGIKQGIICAEGLWKWRLFDFLQHQNHEIFDDLLNKSVQYLTVKDDKRKFRVNVAKNIFKESETIDFNAELYNDNYELVNDPDVSLVITNSEKKDFTYTFNKSGRSYALNAGSFPVGDYTFRGLVTFNGQKLTHSGQFSIQPVQLELFETTADHSVLRALSQKYDGATVYPDNMASIADLIRAKGTVKPVVYSTTKTRSVINLKWIFALLLGLFSAEWFLRRYFGAY